MALDLKYEEDIEMAVSIVSETLGKPGRMLLAGPNVNFNVCVEGPRKTRLWYGDLDLSEDLPKIEALSQKLGFNLNMFKL